MASTHVKNLEVFPFHEPLEAPPGFAVRQSSGALAMQASQPKAPEDWRSPRRCRAIRRFMVPMHDRKAEKALHERFTPDLSQEGTAQRVPKTGDWRVAQTRRLESLGYTGSGSQFVSKNGNLPGPAILWNSLTGVCQWA